jgi:O-antigen biosynthesis protein
MKKILFIGPRIPVFDGASGDLRLFNIIKEISVQYQILYLDAGFWSGDETRHQKALEDLGVVIYKAGTPLRKIFHKTTISCAFIEFYHVAEYFLPWFRVFQPALPVIIDSVDVHFYREQTKYEFTKDLTDLRKARATRSRELNVYRQGDAVIVVTPEDAEVLKKEAPDINTEVIPNIHEIVFAQRVHKDPFSLVFIGSSSHEPNIDAVSYFCGDILPLIVKRIPQVRVKIIGVNPPKGITQFAREHADFLGSVPSVTPYLHKSVVSVAPLRYGAGMKGKIGEAMAHGVPVVTTPVGVQGMGLINRENVLVANSTEVFADAVVELLTDKVLYARIAKNAIDYIGLKFTSGRVGGDVLKMLQRVQDLRIRKYTLLQKVKFLKLGLSKKITCLGRCLSVA